MIKVFGGEWRGLGKKEKHQGMILEFEFRKYLKEFKGARLAVFMCIALHCDENGECFPSYDLIKDETGLTRGTIGAAINDLCELVIEGHRVLHRFRERDEAGKYIGSNHYLVFPTDEEVQSIEIRTVDNQSIKKPQSEKSNGGEIIPEVNPSVKDKPSIKDKRDGASAPPPVKEKKPAAKKPDTVPHEQMTAMVDALAEVTGEDKALNFGRIAKEAKCLITAHYTPAQVKTAYGRTGSYWNADWRGKKGERPSLSTIKETIKQLLNGPAPAGVPSTFIPDDQFDANAIKAAARARRAKALEEAASHANAQASPQ